MGLLEYIIHSWDDQAHASGLGAHMLEIKVEDIYFLASLFRRGALVSLLGGR